MADFWEQFNTMNKSDTRELKAWIMAFMANMTDDEFMKFWEVFWDDMSEDAGGAIIAAIKAGADDSKIKTLLRFTYRCMSMWKMMEFSREEKLQLNPDDEMLEHMYELVKSHVKTRNK
jgi:hypothetical protein